MSGRQQRSVTDLLILLIAGTLCASVLVFGVTLAVLAVARPDLDTSRASTLLAGTINTLTGLLAGWLVGRSKSKDGGGHKDEDS